MPVRILQMDQASWLNRAFRIVGVMPISSKTPPNIQPVGARRRCHPKPVPAVFENSPHGIIAQAIRLVYGSLMVTDSPVPGQTYISHCARYLPKAALFILQYRLDGIAAKLLLIVPVRFKSSLFGLYRWSPPALVPAKPSPLLA